MILQKDSRLASLVGMTIYNRNKEIAEITRKEVREMISLSFLRGNVLLIFFGLFCTLCSGFHAYAEESLICADDIAKYCKEIKPGGGRLLNCLRTHETELSASCRAKISEIQGIIKDCEQACSGDIVQFCKEVQPGGGRIVKCLRGHDKELSSSCSAKLDMISKRFQKKGE